MICEFCIYLYSSVSTNIISLPRGGGVNLLNDYLGCGKCKLLKVRSKDFFIKQFLEEKQR